MHDNFVFIREQGQSNWNQMESAQQTKGYVEATVGVTALRFPGHQPDRLPLPEAVRLAVEKEPGKVVLEATRFNDEYRWFVNGYIPGDL